MRYLPHEQMKARGIRVAMTQDRADKFGAVLTDALLPYKFQTEVRRILKRTPEYAQARAERRAKAWLDQEADPICDTLAAVLRDQLTRLDP